MLGRCTVHGFRHQVEVGNGVPTAGSHKPVQHSTAGTQKRASPPCSTWGGEERDLPLGTRTETQPAANGLRAWLGVEAEKPPPTPGINHLGCGIRLRE